MSDLTTPIQQVHALTQHERTALPRDPVAFLESLGGPTALRIAGRDRSRTRAVTTLIHGNEPSGLRGVHGWLREGGIPTTDVLIWIASVATALAAPRFSHRMLPGHLDLNRCFDSPEGERPEHRLAQAALALLRHEQPEALVDLHNNTGHNPAYAVGPAAGPVERGLASLFGDFFVHSDLALGALVEATAQDFPSVTIECGRAGAAAADATARSGLERLLASDSLPTAHEGAVALLLDPVRVEVLPGVGLALGEAAVVGADLTIARDIDRHNFQQLEPGTPIGWLSDHQPWPLRTRGRSNVDRSRDYFALREGRLETRCRLMPIMMTTDPAIAASDCLFYIVRPA